MTDDTFDLDAQVDAILAHGRALKQQKVANTEDTMTKSLNRAYANAERIHRRAATVFTIATFACD